MKAVVAAFNQEKALVRTFGWNFLRHYWLPDGVLRLHAEQEGRAEVRHVVHAGHVLGAGGGAQVPCSVDIYCPLSRYVC